MIATTKPDPLARQRAVLSTPSYWPAWPFLPVVRRTADALELGVLFDAVRAVGLTGYSATVFFCNLYTLPHSFAAFLALPKEVFDTADEVLAAGWRVD